MSEKENRFDGLMGAVRGKNVQTSKNPDVRAAKTKTQEPSSITSDVQASDNPTTSTSKPRNDSDFKSESQAEDGANAPSSASQTGDAVRRVSAHLNIQTSKIAKSANPDYMRTTVYLPKKMHKKLKAIALEQETEMSSIVEELIEGWLNSQS